uniref:Uncharacterized protein n=1 Tax=Caenorhabditis japonica TaxID=281687 RepID=A0A8R1EDE0_CAEJA
MKKVYTRLSKWDSLIIICGDFNAVVGCSSDDLPLAKDHGTGSSAYSLWGTPDMTKEHAEKNLLVVILVIVVTHKL